MVLVPTNRTPSGDAAFWPGEGGTSTAPQHSFSALRRQATSAKLVRVSDRNISAGVSLAWALALGFGSLSSALALFDRNAIARISLVLDRPGLAWGQALGGYALIAIASRPSPSVPQERVTASKIGWLALLAWTYRLLLLRLEWLTGNAFPSQRLEVEVAALSTSLENLPLYAFFAVLADALLFAHAAICLADSSRAKGWLCTSEDQNLGKAGLIAAGLILYAIGTIATVCLATGRV